VRAVAIFAAVNATLILVLAWLLGLLFTGPSARNAVWVSAGVAFGVQLVAFTLVRVRAGGNVIAGWGAGALLRFATLALYGLIVVKAFALDPAAALLSLAAFFFASMLLEPLLLKS
jgi:hypothetical protein